MVLNVCNPDLSSVRLHSSFYDTGRGFFNPPRAPFVGAGTRYSGPGQFSASFSALPALKDTLPPEAYGP